MRGVRSIINSLHILAKFGVFLMILGAASFILPIFIPRQYFLKVKLDAVPEAIRGTLKTEYSHILHRFPFWMLNKKGKALKIFFLFTTFLGLILIGVSGVIS